MLQAIPNTAKPLKPDLKRCVSSNREIAESGKNFLFWFDKANSRVGDGSEKVRKSSSYSDEQDTHHGKDTDISKLHKIVGEMGLSYFFVLEDVPEFSQVEFQTSSDLSIPLREASQLLSELGFSSEDILSLNTQLKSDGSLDLQAVVDFLSSQSPIHENATISGGDLSKLLSAISFGTNSLHFSLDPQKEFSIEELRNILGRVLKLSDESKKALENASSGIFFETDSSSEITFNDEIGSVYQRDLKDAFAKTVIGALQAVEAKETADPQAIRAENHRVDAKAVNEGFVFVKDPEMANDEESLNPRSGKEEIRDYEEILRENYRQTVVSNPLKLSHVKEILFDYEVQTRMFQANPGGLFERGLEQYVNLVDGGNASNKLVEADQDSIVINYDLEDLQLESDVRGNSNIIRVNLSETLSDSGNSKSDQNFPFKTHGSEIIQSKDANDTPASGIQGFAQILTQAQGLPTISTEVNRIAIIAHVAEQITQMRQLNQNHLVLQLDPPELGRVVIKVSVRDNKVSTSIAAENEEIKDLLNRNTEFLRRHLEEQGLLLDEFSVETNISDKGTSSSSNRDYSRFSGSGNTILPQSFTSKGVVSSSESTRSSVYENREHLIYLFA